jgi:hypothetical protein
LVLIKLDAAAGFDLDRPAVLGSADDVRKRLESVRSKSIRFSVPEPPVVEVGVDIADNDAAAFHALQGLCAQTGWTAFDRATGRFPDLTQASATRRPKSSPPMFYWWTGLPAWIRVLILFALAFLVFDAYMRAWVLSWH